MISVSAITAVRALGYYNLAPSPRRWYLRAELAAFLWWSFGGVRLLGAFLEISPYFGRNAAVRQGRLAALEAHAARGAARDAPSHKSLRPPPAGFLPERVLHSECSAMSSYPAAISVLARSAQWRSARGSKWSGW